MNALEQYMTGLPDAQRETALHIVAEHHLSNNDPLIALLALMRLRDSAFALALDAAAQTQKGALDAHSGQMAREIAELRKDLAQTREAPKLVAESVAQLHFETSGLEKAASSVAAYTIERIEAEVNRAGVRWFVFGLAGGGALLTMLKWGLCHRLF